MDIFPVIYLFIFVLFISCSCFRENTFLQNSKTDVLDLVKTLRTFHPVQN